MQLQWQDSHKNQILSDEINTEENLNSIMDSSFNNKTRTTILSDVTNVKTLNVQDQKLMTLNSLKRKRNNYVKLSTEMESDMLEVMIQEQIFGLTNNENNTIEKMKSITTTFQELYPKQLQELTYRRLSNLSKSALAKGFELFEKRKIYMIEHKVELVFNRYEQAQFNLYIQKKAASFAKEIIQNNLKSKILNNDKIHNGINHSNNLNEEINKSLDDLGLKIIQEQGIAGQVLVDKVVQIVSQRVNVPIQNFNKHQTKQIQQQLKNTLGSITSSMDQTTSQPISPEPAFMKQYIMRFGNIQNQIQILRGRVEYLEAERNRTYQERRQLIGQINEFMHEIELL